MPEKEKANIFHSILFFILSLISLVVFLLIFMILVFFLIKIPIIGNIFTGMMGAEGGDPSRITSYAAVLFSYLLISLLQDKIIRNDNTKTLTRKILGVFIVLWQIVTLVINIVSGTDFASNILLIISGLLFFFWND